MLRVAERADNVTIIAAGFSIAAGVMLSFTASYKFLGCSFTLLRSLLARFCSFRLSHYWRDTSCLGSEVPPPYGSPACCFFSCYWLPATHIRIWSQLACSHAGRWSFTSQLCPHAC